MEYMAPSGVFIAWGYILSVLLTLPVRSRLVTLVISISGATIMLYSMIYPQTDIDFTILIMNRAHALAGLIIITVFVLVWIRKRKGEEDEKNLMEGIFSNGTEGIILVDETDKIILANPFTFETLGYTRNELMQKPIHKVFPTLIQNITNHGFGKPYNNRKSSDVLATELDALHKNGNVFPAKISASRYFSGDKCYVVIFFTDITKYKTKELALRNKKLELEISNKELEAFTYSVSHDLRAPLRAVGGFAQILSDDYNTVFDAEGIRLLGYIRLNAERMGKLIDDLLTFSRLGKIGVKKIRVNMTDIVEKCLFELNQSLPHNAKISVNSMNSVMADPSLITQVITNLLSNAIKYSAKKETPVIEVKSEIKNEAVIFSIIDNGAGFDERYKHKLFGVFQ